MAIYQSPLFYVSLYILAIYIAMCREISTRNDGAMILAVVLGMVGFVAILIILGVDYFIRTRDWTFMTKFIVECSLTLLVYLFIKYARP